MQNPTGETEMTIRRTTLLAALTSMALGACIGSLDSIDPGEEPTPPPPGSLTPAQKAREAFDKGVHPVMMNKCVSCHSAAGGATSTAFVSPNLADAYTTVTSYQTVVGDYSEAGAKIYSYVQGGHHGPYLQDEQGKLLNWLALEVQARPEQGPPPAESPGQVAEKLIQKWSACMKVTDFNAANMDSDWANTNSNLGRCNRCHEVGDSNFIASDLGDGTRMFTAISTDRYFLMSFFVPDVVSAEKKMVMNLPAIRRATDGLRPHTEHSRTNNLNNNGAVDALTQFYNATMENLQNNNCDPAPKLVN